MKVTIEPTSQMVLLGGVLEARIWQGALEDGHPVFMAIPIFISEGDVDVSDRLKVVKASPTALRAFDDYAKRLQERQFALLIFGGDDNGRPN